MARKTRWLATLCAVALGAGLTSAATAAPSRPAAQGSGPGPVGALGLTLDRLLGQSLQAPDVLGAAGLGRLRVPGDVKVLMLSSGIDKGVFPPAGWNGQLSAQGGDDQIGFGTYAASVLFQVAPQAKV